jgi:uncharacterized protein (DUF362 family)/Pyruvate/2-oxoacid:ferredoxin oxidoreductase delta subunit
MDSQVSIIKCADYTPEQVEVSVRKAIGLLGGITRYVKPGSKVLVKPNMLMAKEPEYGIDTHPEVVRQVIRVLKDNNCHIFVGDGPSVWGNEIENIDEVYRRSGILKVCQEEKVELVKFDKRRMRAKFPLTTWLDHCDHLVNIPKLKTHGLTLLTGAIKNLFGLVSGTFKTELHKNYFQIEEFSKIVVDVYAEAKPALTIIDGIVAMEGDGPGTGGKLRSLGLLLAGNDCVALDSVAAKIIGIEPLDVLSTQEASQRGLGTADLNSIEILGEKLEGLKVKPFLLPASTLLKKKFPKPLINALKRLVRYYPYPVRNNCTRCFACVKICPDKCISMQGKGIVFDYRRCIACFCCQETCPSAAIRIKKSLLAKIIGL